MIPVIQTAGSKAGTVTDAKEQFISSLYTSTVQGGWYDPSDLRTMFEDVEGTTPVTSVNQKVGLILDKSQGLIYGAELISNFNFDNGSMDWSGGSITTPQTINTYGTIENGSYNINFRVASNPYDQFYILNQQGKFSLNEMEWYKLEFKLGNFEAGAIQFVLSGAGTQYLQIRSNLASNGVYTEYFCTNPVIAQGLRYTSLQIIGFTSVTGLCKFTVEYVSIKRIPGNHLISSTTGGDFRPTLKGSPNYLEFNQSIMTSVGFIMQTTTENTRKYATFSIGVDASGTIQGTIPGPVGFTNSSFGRTRIDTSATGAFYQLVLRFGSAKDIGYSAIGTYPVEVSGTDVVGIGVNSGNFNLISLGGFKLVWQSVIDFSLSTVNALKNKINSGSLTTSTQLINASYLNTYFNKNYSLLIGLNPDPTLGDAGFFYGKIYSLVVVGEVSDNARLTQILDYINTKMPP